MIKKVSRISLASNPAHGDSTLYCGTGTCIALLTRGAFPEQRKNLGWLAHKRLTESPLIALSGTLGDSGTLTDIVSTCDHVFILGDVRTIVSVEAKRCPNSGISRLSSRVRMRYLPFWAESTSFRGCLPETEISTHQAIDPN